MRGQRNVSCVFDDEKLRSRNRLESRYSSACIALDEIKVQWDSIVVQRLVQEAPCMNACRRKGSMFQSRYCICAWNSTDYCRRRVFRYAYGMGKSDVGCGKAACNFNRYLVSQPSKYESSNFEARIEIRTKCVHFWREAL